MADIEQTTRVDDAHTDAQQKDEARAQQAAVRRMLANPRRVRRA